eukprot:TRINITY_DN1989_c2_g1_i3.p1 TRINITY_DN1989_c2_g1~~TRINITY_DN1989_c2_g1_i3.p1  ORF type:complete len:467 (+),score=160.91 TRINITY_DN1989_c2_g1_i3:87-1487(+)
MRRALLWCAVAAALASSVAAELPAFVASQADAGNHNTSSPSVADDGGSKSQGLGFVGVTMAAVGFGSNFIVIKKYDPGDGMFFQFCMCVAVFMTGLVYHLARGAPPLQPPAMIGGCLWALGNAMCPFIIDAIGMGLGLSVWGAANMLTGWGSAHFGLFGLDKETVSKTGMNVAGALVAVVSVLVYAQVKTMSGDDDESSGDEYDAEEDGADPQIDGPRRRNTQKSGHSVRSNRSESSFSGAGVAAAGASRKGKPAEDGGRFKTLAGLLMSLVAGVFFGSCFTPAQVVSDHAANHHCNEVLTPDACSNVLLNDGRVYCKWDNSADDGKKCGGMPIPDMAFSQFCGIMITSWLILVGYGALQYYRGRKNPSADPGPETAYMYVNVPLILPAFLSGIIWAVAQIGWFIANDNLSMTVAFPIVCATPAIIGNAWGIFVFNEVVRTPRNLGTLCFGMLLSAAAGTLVSISK